MYLHSPVSMALDLALIKTNLLNPATLSFCFGAFARAIRSELSIPKDIHAALSLFLLFSIGLKGGHELALAPGSELLGPALVTILLGLIIPVVAFLILRRIGRMSIPDSAGIAAHYGSVSAVTFIAAQTFVTELLRSKPHLPPLEGYLPTLVALLESPGIGVALALGIFLGDRSKERSNSSMLHEIFTGRSMLLLVGGLFLGALMGQSNWESIAPFFDPKGGIFRGLLCIFLLDMGIAAASRLKDVRKVGFFLLCFGVTMPVIGALFAIVLGQLSGLSVGGTVVLAAMAASASYIAAPPAVKASLPDANPGYYLTLALAITFPFNIAIGIPLYFRLTEWYYLLLS